MHLIDATNAEAYLRDSGRLAAGERVTVRELAGGVSNIVLLVEFADGARPSFVLKQAREQLRVAQPWFCSPERIWREVEVLKICKKVFEHHRNDRLAYDVPAILFEDRPNHLFAMTAAESNARTWKSDLLSNLVRESVASLCGRMLGHLHAESWRDQQWYDKLRDKQFFIDLRVDPYYRHIAQQHAAIRDRINSLIDSTLATSKCLVHGDFSPKNLLVSADRVVLIDFEVGHRGDPAFDVGFFLTHLCLKAVHRPGNSALQRLPDIFWGHYRVGLGNTGEELLSEPRCIEHLLACTLARIDGKSPIDYLDDDERCKVRERSLILLNDPPATMNETVVRFLAAEN